ncbi:glycosyltransferase [Aliidiomarina sp. Khilg15.8]
MRKGKYGLAIINRSFWPDSEILGEAKLRIAEEFAGSGKVCVIAQSAYDVEEMAGQQGRGPKVKFCIAKSRSDSSSGLVKRILDVALFAPFVFWSLLTTRPKHVYVSTNPPVLVPFIVFIYAKLFRASYTYHLQDIHPEITNIVLPMNPLLYRLLQAIDNVTLRHASQLITLSESMAQYLVERSDTEAEIVLIDNPSFDVSDAGSDVEKIKDVVFCGNAGRVQQIPIVLASIKQFFAEGGSLEISFAGGGIYAPEIQALADTFPQVTYYGYVKPQVASQLVAEHRWALLPIEDEVTKYAFPSKSSSYLASGCRILGICGPETSVASWIDSTNSGLHVEARVSEVVKALHAIEDEKLTEYTNNRASQNVQSLSSFVTEISMHLDKA